MKRGHDSDSEAEQEVLLLDVRRWIVLASRGSCIPPPTQLWSYLRDGTVLCQIAQVITGRSFHYFPSPCSPRESNSNVSSFFTHLRPLLPASCPVFRPECLTEASDLSKVYSCLLSIPTSSSSSSTSSSTSPSSSSSSSNPQPPGVPRKRSLSVMIASLPQCPTSSSSSSSYSLSSSHPNLPMLVPRCEQWQCLPKLPLSQSMPSLTQVTKQHHDTNVVVSNATKQQHHDNNIVSNATKQHHHVVTNATKQHHDTNVVVSNTNHVVANATKQHMSSSNRILITVFALNTTATPTCISTTHSSSRVAQLPTRLNESHTPVKNVASHGGRKENSRTPRSVSSSSAALLPLREKKSFSSQEDDQMALHGALEKAIASLMLGPKQIRCCGPNGQYLMFGKRVHMRRQQLKGCGVEVRPSDGDNVWYDLRDWLERSNRTTVQKE